ncbi:copper homeostasis periplasmic binding protein CopC [Lichenihabitans psoromatis]|uniref:copper homeostasis periplasmic binding protein CopC n=1 Tax=Lichenihabitans psoromatis TaxID=2528642 RepID=UPI001036A684|nr:copper homeostasis periplasmic binding protein CopC [Lichenihabitans psoromatis]
MNTFARTLVLAGLGLFAASAPVFAHAHLKSANPPINGTASSPSELDLMFSEGLNLKFTGVKLMGPDKAAVTTGDATLGSSGDTTLVVPVTGTLAAGTYMVAWHALSTDGHKTTGTYKFTVKP